MSFQVPNSYRVRSGRLGSSDHIGNNGAFEIPLPCGALALTIASDGLGWEHVSASLPARCLSWEEMCIIKGIFWGRDDCVVQYHPPERDYVNCHPYCLHLWRPVGIAMPRPPALLVGPQGGAL